MSVLTNPRDPSRGVATVAVSATVIAVAFGATACAGTPAGSSSQARLAVQASLSGQQAAALPSAVLAMTPTTASMNPRQRAAASLAASPGTGHAKSPAPSTAPASSGPAASHASQAPSATVTWTAPAAPATASSGSTPASAPATGSTPSEPATGGSSTGALSLTTGCAAVTTVQALSSFSCPVTVSGGIPGYGWTLFVNGQDAALNGTLPPGIETTGTDTTYIIGGKPEQWGTFTFAVTVMDSTPTSPPHTASTSFTIIVPEPPPQDLMP
jgi:hypothetical protein